MKLDSRIFGEKNVFNEAIFNDSLSLNDFLTRLNAKEILYLQKEINNEAGKRVNLLYEMIPGMQKIKIKYHMNSFNLFHTNFLFTSLYKNKDN